MKATHTIQMLKAVAISLILTIKDNLIGKVRLCTGEFNMDMTVTGETVQLGGRSGHTKSGMDQRKVRAETKPVLFESLYLKRERVQLLLRLCQ